MFWLKFAVNIGDEILPRFFRGLTYISHEISGSRNLNLLGFLGMSCQRFVHIAQVVSRHLE